MKGVGDQPDGRVVGFGVQKDFEADWQWACQIRTCRESARLKDVRFCLILIECQREHKHM